MKRNAIAVMALACALTTHGGGVEAQERTSPSWARPADPLVAEMLYPGFAAMLEQGGWARIRCWIEDDGHPFLCEVADEAPHGLGFGAAARVTIASADVRAARVDGQIVGRMIQTTVRFAMADEGVPFGGWTGPEPSGGKLALARKVVSDRAEDFPPSYRDSMMNGLDFDRRSIVGAWIDELMPFDPVRATDALVLQAARLFTEDELQRMLAGENIDPPSDEDFYAASPDATPEDEAAITELKRRYCDRWECGVDPLGTTS